MSRKVIGVSCYGIGYDLTGFVDVEFRQLSQGFSVWSRDSESEKPSRLKKVGSSNKPLNWRSVCEFLFKNQNLHVGGFWDSVDVRGVDPWAIDLIKCAFVMDEDLSNSYQPIVKLFMGFEDNEVREVIDQLDGFLLEPTDHTGFENLEVIADTAKDLGLFGKPLSSILESVELPRGATLDKIAGRIGTLCRIVRTAEELGFVDKSLPSIRKALGLRRNATLYKIAVSIRTLLHIVKTAEGLGLVEKSRPYVRKAIGLQKNATLNEIDDRISAVYNEEQLQKLLDLAKSGTDSDAVKKQWSSVMNGPHRDLPTTLILVDLWLNDPHRPDDWDSLRWLVGAPESMEALLSELKEHTPEKAARLAEEVMKHCKYFAHHFEIPCQFRGGPWQAVVGRRMMKDKVHIAIEYQAVLGRLAIPIDPQYRIGILRYL